MAIAQTIDTAPRDGYWVLGYVPDIAEFEVPWIAITWGDRGWRDNDGEPCAPTLWSALPDPQPRPTGWAAPEGVIHVEEITGEGWTSNGKPIAVPYRWAVYIMKRDGSYDEYRETWHYAAYPQAEARAAEWNKQFGLDIAVSFMDPKVVPFAKPGGLQ